jgi:cytochrome c
MNKRRLIVAGLCLLATAAPLRAEGDPARGQRAFQRCYACHSLDPAERNLQGPSLDGLFGRRAGTRAGYDYSPAMVAAGRNGLIWTEETLEAFIADPQAVVPDTNMAPMRMTDPAERADLIAYLKRASR